jgi:ribosomal-protein-serine acetyltransferase
MSQGIGIRPYELRDVEPLYEAIAESVSEISPWLPWCHAGYSLAESRAWIEHCLAAWSEQAEYNFAIVGPAGRLLGGCGLNQLRREHRIANLGYWVRTSAAGAGVAPAAVRKVAGFAFRETELARLEIVVAVDNARSHRVAAKVGALREGIAHDRLYAYGASRDAVIYALLRSRPEHAGEE